MSKIKILITDRFSLRAKTLLEEQYEVFTSLNEAKQELQNVQALIVRSRTQVNKSLLDQMPNLKVIATCTSGFDHIDLQETQKRNITTAFTPEANAASAAELTWALVLACSRSLVSSHKNVTAGNWQTHLPEGMQLEGKTYGVIGVGRIGQRVAKIAQSFGMNVLAFDPYADENAFAHAERKGLEELLKMSEVISLHVPLTRETKRMLNRSTLEYIHRDAILVNTSRGEIVDEVDLLEALKKGWLRAAGLDVFIKEPLAKDSGLLESQKLILTPHVGGRTEEAYERASIDAAKQVLAYFTTGNVAHPLPPKALWYTSPKGFN